MKKTVSVALMMIAATCAVQARAADNKVMLPIAAALEANDAKGRLGEEIKFYFAGQSTPTVLKKLGSDHTSQKTNSVGKSVETACNWAFLSAMLQLQKRAQALGANAVVNIVSNYKNIEFKSATEFECAEGAIMAGVALKGDFVKIAP